MSVSEVLVVIGLIAVLLAIVLPAVQWAREASRRSHCSNNLRQIASAISLYEGTYKVFPPAFTSRGGFLVLILPFLEQTAISDRMSLVEQGLANYDTFSVTVPTYVCTSDGAPLLMRTQNTGKAGANYAGNAGTWVVKDGFNGIFRYLGNIGFDYGVVRAADVSDGLSRTACVAEILRAEGQSSRLRTVWNTPLTYSQPTEMDAFANMCRSLPPNPTQYGWQGDPWIRGTPWVDGNMTITLYNHVAGPNSPSCFNRSSVPTAASSSSSGHPGLVLLAYADCHVDAVRNEVDERIWRAIASRNGGE